VPHIICGGFTKEETENALIDLDFLGIDNLLALRGDAIKPEKAFLPEPNGHAYITYLIKQIMSMNEGKYLDEEINNPVPTKFLYKSKVTIQKSTLKPSNSYMDIRYLKEKIDFSTSYIVTQFFLTIRPFFIFKKILNP